MSHSKADQTPDMVELTKDLTSLSKKLREQNDSYRSALKEAHALLRGGVNPDRVAEHIAKALSVK